MMYNQKKKRDFSTYLLFLKLDLISIQYYI